MRNLCSALQRDSLLSHCMANYRAVLKFDLSVFLIFISISNLLLYGWIVSASCTAKFPRPVTSRIQTCSVATVVLITALYYHYAPPASSPFSLNTQSWSLLPLININYNIKKSDEWNESAKILALNVQTFWDCALHQWIHTCSNKCLAAYEAFLASHRYKL